MKSHNNQTNETTMGFQPTKCSFGKEGNAVTMSDHYDQNSVSFYLHKDELGKLANFIKDSIKGDQSNV
jgi:hypothetical protein